MARRQVMLQRSRVHPLSLALLLQDALAPHLVTRRPVAVEATTGDTQEPSPERPHSNG